MSIKQSELILNPDGSVYHLNLKPEHIAENIIFVGDQDRVDKVSKYFDTIEFTTQKREFKTTTGTYKNKLFSVISTGIGPDNIDIVLNELDALVNINLKTRIPKENLTSLNIVRTHTLLLDPTAARGNRYASSFPPSTCQFLPFSSKKRSWMFSRS